MPFELLIIRHGQTEWSASGQHTGVTDIALTPEGRIEAARLSPIMLRLLNDREARVYASPRKRALETAELALPGREVIVEELVREFEYGDYEGLTDAEINKISPGWEIWQDPCPNGESIDDVGGRADAFLDQLERIGFDTIPIVVTHGHFSRILAARALTRPARDGELLGSSTGSVSIVKDRRGIRQISLWNLTSGVV